MMNRNHTDKTIEEEPCLKVSDWVTFLTGQMNSMLSNVISYGVFLVAVIAIIFAGGDDFVTAVIGWTIASVVIAYAYFRTLRRLGKRGALAQKILGMIMSGELKDEPSIREEWASGLAAFERGRATVRLNE